MNIPDHIFESLETIFGVKIHKFSDADTDPGSENLFDPGSKNLFDPGSGMEKNRFRDPGLTSRIRNANILVPTSSLASLKVANAVCPSCQRNSRVRRKG